MEKKDTEALIYVCNDDGIYSKGIDVLVRTMKKLGEVVVLAPDRERSGVSHAITMREKLQAEQLHIWPNTLSYKFNGTPVDCVKFALHKVLKRKPDLMVSGINHGSNASVNLIYSGTVAAAMEASINSIPSIAFSHVSYDEDTPLELSAKIVEHICKTALKNGIPNDVFFNVNIPDVSEKDFRGIKVCKQARSQWHESFIREENTENKESFLMTGVFECIDKGNDTDDWALNHNYAALVPVELDMTAHHFLNNLKKRNVYETY
jgi:5'-nucleotidase